MVEAGLMWMINRPGVVGAVLQTAFTAIARCRPTGASHNLFLPEFTEYIVYANLDSHKEAALDPIVEEPSQRTELVKILLKFPIYLDLLTN